jgi:hypothetical protein
VVALPLILVLIASAPDRPIGVSAGRAPAVRLIPWERRPFLLMAGVPVLGGAAMSLFSAHVVALLRPRGVSLASAVAFGALIGPALVAVRVVEMAGQGAINCRRR